MNNTQSEMKLNSILNYLQSYFEEFPYNEIVERKFFELLMLDFKNLDIEEELKQYHAWTLDQKHAKKLNHHSRFRLWLKRANRSDA